MQKKTTTLLFLFMFLALIAWPLAGLCQPTGQAASPAAKTQGEAPTITIKAKVVYQQQTASYMAIGVNPPNDHYFIVNENKPVLDKLVKSGEAVTIEGTLPRGAEFIQIDKIDGKKYTSDK